MSELFSYFPRIVGREWCGVHRRGVWVFVYSQLQRFSKPVFFSHISCFYNGYHACYFLRKKYMEYVTSLFLC